MSSAAEPSLEISQAPAAGALLRAARERVGWPLADIAAALRIRSSYLEALEDGRVDELPGSAYALGFLRTYANALGLDANDIARRFKSEAALVNRRPELQFPVPVPDRGVPAGALALLGVLLAMGAYAGWYTLSGDGRLPAETSLQVPARLAPLAEQATPAPAPSPTEAVAATTPVVPPAPPALSIVVAPEPRTDAPPVPQISPSSAAAAVTPLPAQSTPPQDAADPSRILLRANADAWIQVRDRGGNVLFNRILHAGETWPVPAQPNLLLTTGNAGGTELLVDGATTPSLGSSGSVRRDLPLDPDLIKAGKLTASPLPPVIQTGAIRLAPQ
jgi:cytoskeleton protein RodZ